MARKNLEMTRKERVAIFFFFLIFLTFAFWLIAIVNLHGMPKQNKGAYLVYSLKQTFMLSDWRVILIMLIPSVILLLIAKKEKLFRKDVYQGQKYKKFLRGTQLVSPEKMQSLCKDKKNNSYQLTIADIPIPLDVEALHFLENGSTGTGKSVAIKEVVACIQKRKKLYEEYNSNPKNKEKKKLDRMIVIDPNGDLYSLFADSKKDILMNPFDSRTVGWNIFNEIKTESDYNRFCFSIVPRTEGENERWNSYARLLLKECLKYVKKNPTNGIPTFKQVQYMATVLEEGILKDKLAGTDAESLFVRGADKALGSARFTLSDRMPSFNLMPLGDFSLLDSLDDNSNMGDIYITWREDQIETLKPLITAFADIFISGILSLKPSKERSIFLFLDELASMDAISSLRAGLEKGRKHGLKIFAGVQSIDQLKSIYGEKESVILMSNFRNLVVLGGSKTDPETSEFMSKAIGEMEVIRENITRSKEKSIQDTKYSERVVLPSEISNLAPLHLYLSFAGEYPVTKTTLNPNKFNLQEVNLGFIPISEEKQNVIKPETVFN